MKTLGAVAIVLVLMFGLYACFSVFDDCYSKGGRIVKNLYGVFECIEIPANRVQWK